MRVTVRVRINWPVPAVKLLDAVTVAVGGDPQTIRRDETHPCEIFGMHRVSNEPDQGLKALVQVLWSEEPDHGWPDEPEPPALVVLLVNTSGELHPRWDDLNRFHETDVLAVVRDSLDQQGVPRTAWWWSCEYLGHFPGTLDIVAGLSHLDELRDLYPEGCWAPEQT